MFSFILDEHMRGKVVNAIRNHHAVGAGITLDVMVVGEPVDLPLGSPDPDILFWAERHGRLLVTYDKRSMPGHLAAHLAAGRHIPGILCIPRLVATHALIAALELVEGAGQPDDFADTITYLP